MSAIGDKHSLLSDDNKATNNIRLEDEMYQQMNLIKLEDLNVVHLEEIRRKLDRKYGKMAVQDETTEIGDELDL